MWEILKHLDLAVRTIWATCDRSHWHCIAFWAGGWFQMVWKWDSSSDSGQNMLQSKPWTTVNTHTSFRLRISIIGRNFLPPFDVTIYTATTCCLESAGLCCSVDPHCTQAYKHGPGSRRCPPYRQEPKVPPVEMSLFPLGCHTMSATLWSRLKALQAKAFAHSTHSTAKALTLARSY